MKQRGKRKMAAVLTFVMLAVFLCGGTVMAQKQQIGDVLYAGGIRTGDCIRGISATAPVEGSVDYSSYRFFINGKEYSCGADGNVFFNPSYVVTDIQTDDTNKTIKISGDFMIEFQLNGNDSWRKRGEQVSVNLTEEYKTELDGMEEGDIFWKWYVWTYKSGEVKDYDLETSAAFLGVAPEVLEKKECAFTFTIPDAWEEYQIVGIKPAIEWNSTVSGNVPSQPEEGVSGGSSQSGGSSSAAAPVIEEKKEVILSNGTVIKSLGAMQNVAHGINGAAIITPQEDMNTRAGLSAQDAAAGSSAKLYMGNTYKAAEKTQLTQAVSQLGVSAFNMINIDLYSIAKSGKVANIKGIAGEEPVRLVIGLPAGIAKEGRSFSLVYMGEDGKAVEIPDLDNDPLTLTVDLTRFGAFAIVYR